MLDFTFSPRIPRTIFGAGSLEKLPQEVDRLSVQHVLLITGPSVRGLELAERASKLLGKRVAGICSEAVMHTPREVTENTLAKAKHFGADCLVTLGGGSTVGLGKALSIRMKVPHITVPTTYAGSEATPILGETVNRVKTTRTDPMILPDTIIYDVTLTLGLSPQLSYTSGMNAIAHCVEALYSTQLNPIIEGAALSGIAAIYEGLRTLRTKPNDREARTQMLAGAWAAGVCLGHINMGLHHKLCHTLGGSFDLPHSATHAIILPHAMAYNANAAPKAMAQIRKAIGSEVEASVALWELQQELGVVASLEALGMRAEDLEMAADLAMKAEYPNPEPLSREKLIGLLRRAFEGLPPC